jgi:cell shape-determining protein MreD
MPSSTLFLATLLGFILGILLDGALGGLLGGAGAFLLLRIQQLSARIRTLEQASKADGDDDTPPTPP